MSTFKLVTIPVPIDAYNRIKRLWPSKRKGRHNIPEFVLQVLLGGLEHPRFLNREHQRCMDVAEWENRMLQTKLSAAESKLGQPNNQAANIPALAETLARLTDQFRQAKATQVDATPESKTSAPNETVSVEQTKPASAPKDGGTATETAFNVPGKATSVIH